MNLPSRAKSHLSSEVHTLHREHSAAAVKNLFCSGILNLIR